MDPNPNTFPILSYVMSKLPSIGPKQATQSAEYDIEQPPPPSDDDTPAPTSPLFELTEHMPHLADPTVVAAMQLAVSEVAQSRSVLQTLGDRPDHESVDNAKAKLAETEAALSKQLEEIVLSPRPAEVDRFEWRSRLAVRERERRRMAEEERHVYQTVIQIDEMHEAYEKLLKDAEQKLVRIYQSAAYGGDDESKQYFPIPDEMNEEVVGILQDGKGIERIDLSGRHLPFLPEAFGRLRQLVVLNLSTNLLEVIPDSVAGLENLEELYISSNLLESLPDSVGFLFRLKVLDASGNKLTTLPDSICHCRSLVELNASSNKITYLPKNIGYELVNLRRLAIHMNKIRHLPASIGEMRSLRLLDVHFNELQGLPRSIGNLTNLEILDLSTNFNHLKELPDTFGGLTNLKELDLSHNQISALPESFGRLDKLTKLNLDQNPMVIPPKEVVIEGVEAVKVFTAKRWFDILVEEERKSRLEVKERAKSGWLTRSTSWLSSFASGVSGRLGAGGKYKVDPDSYLDQPL